MGRLEDTLTIGVWSVSRNLNQVTVSFKKSELVEGGFQETVSRNLKVSRDQSYRRLMKIYYRRMGFKKPQLEDGVEVFKKYWEDCGP